MICCFFNLHEQENAKDLVEHFDKEIEVAIGRGCTRFIAGVRYPEDALFCERVQVAAKHYADGEIKFLQVDETDDKALKNLFISLADWEIYSYEV